MASLRWAFLLLAAVLLAGCGSDESTTNEASQSLSRYEGTTFAFDYPTSWHIWDSSYMNNKELVILANVAEEGLGHDLPDGAIKVDISSTDIVQTTVDPPPDDAQLLNFPPSDVKYFLYSSEEPNWTIRGVVQEADRLYILGVLMQTEQADIEAVRALLSSWQQLR